jgi:hypothetical protein
MEKPILTDSEKIEAINRRTKVIERNSYVHITIVLLGFLGIVTIGALMNKIKGVKK